jgi:hypothetical protein
MAGFNHVVGSTRFVGYFLQAGDLCRVTVFKAAADDEASVSPPERGQTKLGVKPGAVSTFT